METNQTDMLSNLFDSGRLEEESDEEDVSMFDDAEAEEDQKTATIKENFKQYLLANKFTDVMFQYSSESMWEALKPRYRRIYATMLIDEANTNNIGNYPDFWSNYL